MISWFRTRTPSSPMAPMPSSGWNGTPSLRTTITSSGAPSARATSKATGTPPRGRPSTTTRCPRRCCSLAASCRPASARSAKRMAPLLPGQPPPVNQTSPSRGSAPGTMVTSGRLPAAATPRRTAPCLRPGTPRSRFRNSQVLAVVIRRLQSVTRAVQEPLESLIHSAVCKAAEHLRPAQVRSPGSTPRILASGKAYASFAQMDDFNPAQLPGHAAVRVRAADLGR